MKKMLVGFVALMFICTPLASLADEGMWLLPFIKDKNIQDMKKVGFKLSAEDIYNINGNALKDAIVIFGGGCTGEVVSAQGLLLTNHHCGYATIQQHSSVEADYLKNGYWAQSFETEIPSPGLAVTFIRNVVDVSDEILPFLSDTLSKAAKFKLFEAVKAKYKPEGANMSINIQPMFGGNQYLLFVQERFGDVRFVGAPPTSIGKFGGEQDNWMWPRHTGDFSVFRIYADKDGKSTAGYKKENVPYAAPKFLNISSKGYKKGDPAMIIGFPGTTTRYMTSFEIEQMLTQDNPIRIYIRGEKQNLMREDMLASDAVRIKYANKYAGSSNYWKNSIGKSRGVKRLHVKEKKEAEQAAFTAWVNADDARKAKYGQALPMIEEAVKNRMPLQREAQINSEIFNSTEAIQLASIVDAARVVVKDSAKMRAFLKRQGDAFFKNYNMATDKKITKRLIEIYLNYTPEEQRFEWTKLAAKDVTAWVDNYFASSPLVEQARFDALVENLNFDCYAEFLNLAKEITARSKAIRTKMAPWNEMFEKGHRLYLAGLLEMTGGKGMYPDANFTQRMSYGQVLPYKGADALNYDFNTTLSGVMEKENAEDPEFVVPVKLKELWEAKDFGRWAVNGDVPVAFLSNNDITGGNSGSPVMNGKGELLGLAFDGNWEAMSGDIAFEPALQRTISVDIRYVLFVIDKFAGATRLIDEMVIK